MYTPQSVDLARFPAHFKPALALMEELMPSEDYGFDPMAEEVRLLDACALDRDETVYTFVVAVAGGVLVAKGNERAYGSKELTLDINFHGWEEVGSIRLHQNSVSFRFNNENRPPSSVDTFSSAHTKATPEEAIAFYAAVIRLKAAASA